MISGTTQVLGVIGHPIEHTSSPAMHNAALQALGLDAVYVAFHVQPDGLQQVVCNLNILGFISPETLTVGLNNF